MSIDRCPLVSDQAEMLLATRVPGYRHGRTTSGQLLGQARAHLEHRLPDWDDGEGAHGHVDIRFLPRLRVGGQITWRYPASRSYRL